ncbi:hypothetical protein HZA73_09485 [candidate division TA06 bacterium]|nr:hypothetical protein [candidate division TA06 bacterium]
MGRTIHYEITGAISDDQWDKIDALQDRYNIDHRWTCECLSLTRIPFWYPRWPNQFKDSKLDKGITANEAWKIINRQLDGLSGVALEKKVFDLVDEKILVLGDRSKKDITASGFTKVADNEWNAQLVIDFLTETSKIAKDSVVKIYDEGDYSLCHYVIIRNGVVSLDHERIRNYLAGLKERQKDSGMEDYFKEEINTMRENLVLSGKGIFFAKVDPREYQDHPQFRTLTLNLEQVS